MRRTPRTAVSQPPKTASPWFPNRRPFRWAVLFCVTAIAYAPALPGTFLWDDDQHITRLDLQSVRGLWRIWSDLGATQQYYPLLHSAFWIEHRLWGDSALGYHLANVALHAISALLVILIVERLKLPGAWLAGFVFALHPVCTESVAWITEQKNTLSGVYYLAATLVYLRFDETRQRTSYWRAVIFFILALLSKTALATLPAILLTLIWWRRGRLAWRRDILPLLPWFGVAVTFGLLTYYVETVYLGAGGAAFSLSLPQRVLLAGRTPWFYASKALLPLGLIFCYPRWLIDPAIWWQYLFPAGLAAVATWFAVVGRRNRGPIAALLIFIAALFPILGLLHVFYFRYSFVADHFQYLACLALIVPLCAVLSDWLAHPGRKRWGAVAPAVLLVFLGGLTWAQAANYSDVETLYRGILARNPESWLAHNNLGLLLASEPGGLPEAIDHYRAAVRIEPAYFESHFNLGSALAHSGSEEDKPEAIAEYRSAVGLKPDYVEAHYNLANLLSGMPGRLQDAIGEYRIALALEPGLAEAHANLGNALAQTPGGAPSAIVEYETALRLKPALAMPRINLANALAETPGRLPDAIAQYQAALHVEPNFADGHYFLAKALAQMPGRSADAIAECEMALRIDPGLAPAMNLLEALRAARK